MKKKNTWKLLMRKECLENKTHTEYTESIVPEEETYLKYLYEWMEEGAQRRLLQNQ